MFFINLLIIIFSFLTVYQVYLEISKSNLNLIEGITNNNSTTNSNSISYKDYGSSDPSTNALILSQQNAGNIAFLKQQVDGLDDLKSQVKDLTQEVDTMSTQINQISQQQATYATQIAGSKPVNVTGTTNTIS
jgi:methyl-accepting chemotaxis protein